jgi:hypothetical protein
MRPEILTVPLPLILPTIVMVELIEETSKLRLGSGVMAGQVKELDCVSVGLSLGFLNMSRSFLLVGVYRSPTANSVSHFAVPCGRGS